MTDEDTSEHAWVGGANVKILTSLDGVYWGAKSTVFPVQTNWPGMVATDSSHFIVMGDNGGAKVQHYHM